ncbi:MAG TPA: histidine phosphatase family protein [Pseudolabrys sp.]|nr:histidine phosphatase family protein [Pseudolabrys sp.]
MTMRRLLLFRHAKAERSVPGTEDRARRLIERGQTDAAKIGAYMASHALIPDRVMTSPSVRTQETWKLAASSFPSVPAATAVDALYDATPQSILGVIRGVPQSVRNLLIVGHNPGLQAIALLLIASGDIEARERLREKFPTAGLVVIEFAFEDWSKLHPKSGRLERFVTPKSLAATAN